MQISPLAVSFLLAFASAAPMPVPQSGWGCLAACFGKLGSSVVKSGATEGVQSATSSLQKAGANLERASSGAMPISPFEIAAKAKPFERAGAQHAASSASGLGPLKSTDHLLPGRPGDAVTGTKSQALARQASAKAKLDAAKGTTALEHVDSLPLHQERIANAKAAKN